MTVSLPQQDFVTGGGFLTNQNLAGTYAGDAGLRTNFGFNVKFNKALTNVTGKVNIIVRQDGRVYQIKTNATDSLTVQTMDPVVSQATFTAKANLKDITDPLNPISLGGNLDFISTLTDAGEPGTSDTIALTVWDGAELLFSSHWTGVETIEQLLGGGNLLVHIDPQALQAESVGSIDFADSTVLTPEQLNPIVAEAVARWASADLEAAALQSLADVEIRTADLPGTTLGWALGATIWIDADAGGQGWFIDSTPTQSEEFVSLSAFELAAPPGSPAYGQMDMLTVVMHEMGHVLGFADLDPDTHPHDLMTEALTTGVRRMVSDGGDSLSQEASRTDEGQALRTQVGPVTTSNGFSFFYVPPSPTVSPLGSQSDSYSTGSGTNGSGKDETRNGHGPRRWFDELFKGRFGFASASKLDGVTKSDREAERKEHELIVDMEDSLQDSGSLNQAVVVGHKVWLQDFLDGKSSEKDPNEEISVVLD